MPKGTLNPDSDSHDLSHAYKASSNLDVTNADEAILSIGENFYGNYKKCVYVRKITV